MNFIHKLQQQRSDYKYASQARTQAESLKQLSAGIYTEEERFVYELLQNAVDAFVDTENKCLEIRIVIKGNVLCFMHNGSAFTERDIEGLCDVGKSPKAGSESVTNKKKVGYKGIGFKSVFMQSVDYVCVKSGNYCFKFDKAECSKLMPDFPDDTLDADDIPWQIVPIPCSAPTAFDTSGYNVATFIRTETISNISLKIKKLLQDPHFLLFLNANDINIVFQRRDNAFVTAGRKTVNGKVHLLCNNRIVSRWLVHTTNPIAVDSSIRKSLEKDFNTPPKLKTATEYEISFAISINEKGELQKVEESVLYTFLPTSYKNLGVPFLVNANFITDAGRQQLHQHSEWNRLIFGSIVEHYLEWLAALSRDHEDYYKVLPSTTPKSSDELTAIYSESFNSALRRIAFIPSNNSRKLLKVSEAVLDSIDFAPVCGTQSLVSYINKEYSKAFNNYSFFDCKDSERFDEYGVFDFNINKLETYFSSIEENISASKCIEIARYLNKLTENSETKEKLYSVLSNCKFVVCEDGSVKVPSECYFPTEYSSDNKTYVPIIHSSVFEFIKREHLFDWFKELGVENMSIGNYLRDVYCKANFKITEDNALEVGKIVYDAFLKGQLIDIKKYLLRELRFLSTKGNLHAADELYLSHIYHPQFELDNMIDDDIFVSDKYAEIGDVNIWKSIFLLLGVSENLNLRTTRIKGKITSIADIPEDHQAEIVAIEEGLIRKITYIEMYGYELEYYPCVLKLQDNNVLSVLFSSIFAKGYEKIDNTCYLEYRYQIRVHLHERGDLWHREIKNFSVRDFFLRYCQLYPSSTGEPLHANDLFLNTELNSSLCGKYLPVLDVPTQPSEDWLSVLPFKRDLLLEDLLSLLNCVAEDNETDNKERVSSIYKRIVELGLQSNPAIAEWGKAHKLLSTNEREYLSPGDLSYITVEGFKNSTKAYLGKHDKSMRDGLLCLLQSFGVKVITNEMIEPLFENEVISDELKLLLRNKLDFITLLKSDVNDYESFEKAKEELSSQLEKCIFYRCDRIELSYGDKDDVVEKKTFSRGNCIYYVGKLNPTRLEPLTACLAKCLNIKSSESHELLVILITNDRLELIEYLNDKGYSTDLLPEPVGNLGTVNSHFSYDESSLNNHYEDGEVESDESDSSSNTSEKNEYNNARSQEKQEEFIREYSEKVSEFMGGGFSMPEDDIKAKHVIARYRALMYIKEYATYLSISPDFDEKDYIRSEKYTPIPLVDGKKVHVQGASYGIWYLSPAIWNAIVNLGHYACLCTGFDELDFRMIMDKDDVKSIAESSNNVLMKMSASNSMDIMSTIESVLNPDCFDLGNGIRLDTIYADRNVHLMLKVHQTPDSALNSIFDQVFKSEGNFGLD